MSSIKEFVWSRPGSGFIKFALFSTLLAAGVGYGTYSLNLRWYVANKGEEKITALQLVDAFVTNYSDIRGRFNSDEVPVPAMFRACHGWVEPDEQSRHLLWTPQWRKPSRPSPGRPTRQHGPACLPSETTSCSVPSTRPALPSKAASIATTGCSRISRDGISTMSWERSRSTFPLARSCAPISCKAPVSAWRSPSA